MWIEHRLLFNQRSWKAYSNLPVSTFQGWVKHLTTTTQNSSNKQFSTTLETHDRNDLHVHCSRTGKIRKQLTSIYYLFGTNLKIFQKKKKENRLLSPTSKEIAKDVVHGFCFAISEYHSPSCKTWSRSRMSLIAAFAVTREGPYKSLFKLLENIIRNQIDLQITSFWTLWKYLLSRDTKQTALAVRM